MMLFVTFVKEIAASCDLNITRIIRTIIIIIIIIIINILWFWL